MNAQGHSAKHEDARTRPVIVRNLTGVNRIAGAGGHSLALRSDGPVGRGVTSLREMGDGTFTNRTTPVSVATPPVVVMWRGSRNSWPCGQDGPVWEFGDNKYGKGATTTRQTVEPVSGAR